MTERFKMIASVYILFVRDEKIFLMRRAHTGYEDGKYGLPSGHVEEGESLTSAVVRETLEETGVRLVPTHVSVVHTMHRIQDDERIDFFFVAHEWDGEPLNTETHKCDDAEWFPLDSLPSNTIPYIRQAIEAYCTGVLYSEFGWTNF